MPLGIASLRDLCTYRPAIRSECLKALFEYSESLGRKSENSSSFDCRLRDHACNALARFVTHDSMGSLIIEAASTNVKSLFGEGGTNKSADEVLAKLALFLSLCLTKPDLIAKLFDWAPHFGKDSFDILSNACLNIVFPRVPSESIIELVSSFPGGSEELAYVLIKTLLKKESVMQDVIEKTRVTFIDRNLDVKFLLLVITHLDKDNVLKQIGKVVASLDRGEEQKQIVQKLFVDLTEVRQGLNDETPKSLITPAELLIALHTLEDSIGLKKALEGLGRLDNNSDEYLFCHARSFQTRSLGHCSFTTFREKPTAHPVYEECSSIPQCIQGSFRLCQPAPGEIDWKTSLEERKVMGRVYSHCYQEFPIFSIHPIGFEETTSY
jgi:hypothetical protein